jgi:hypothetical protein
MSAAISQPGLCRVAAPMRCSCVKHSRRGSRRRACARSVMRRRPAWVRRDGTSMWDHFWVKPKSVRTPWVNATPLLARNRTPDSVRCWDSYSRVRTSDAVPSGRETLVLALNCALGRRPKIGSERALPPSHFASAKEQFMPDAPYRELRDTSRRAGRPLCSRAVPIWGRDRCVTRRA